MIHLSSLYRSCKASSGSSAAFIHFDKSGIWATTIASNPVLDAFVLATSRLPYMNCSSIVIWKLNGHDISSLMKQFQASAGNIFSLSCMWPQYRPLFKTYWAIEIDSQTICLMFPHFLTKVSGQFVATGVLPSPASDNNLFNVSL